MSTSLAEFRNSDLRCEDDLLLCCAKASIDAGTEARIRDLLRQKVDWNYVIDAAAAHGVKPLLCHNLTNRCAASVPKTLLVQFRRYIQAHAFNNLFLTRELIRLLGLLEKSGISAIPWKGPVLAATAYGNVGLRQFGDLDILVREHDAMRGKDLLLSAGYRLQYQGSAENEVAFHNARKVCELIREDGRVVVELHWAITSQTFPFRLAPASLWENIATVSLEGAPVPNLSPEDLLLVLCVHGAKHHWGKVMWISDIAQVLQTYSDKIDWNRVTQRADGLGGARMLFLGLLLAHDLLGATVPKDPLQAVQADPKVRLLATEVRARLFAGPAVMAVDRPAFYIQLRERPRDRFRCRLYLGYRMLAPQTQAWTLRFLHSARSVRHFLHRRNARAQ
jgi:hypothetical protein